MTYCDKVIIFDLFKKCCKNATLKHFGKWREEKEVKEISEKAKKLKAIIYNNNFGCAKEAVLELVSELIGESLKADNILGECKGYYYPPFPGVVFLLDSNPNSHNYPLCTALIKTYGEHALIKGMHQGNDLPFINTIFHPPTLNEFNTFMENIKNEELHSEFPLEELFEYFSE